MLSVSSLHQLDFAVVAVVEAAADSAERTAVEFAVVVVQYSRQPAMPEQQVEQDRVVWVLLVEHLLQAVLEQQSSVAAVYSDRPH